MLVLPVNIPQPLNSIAPNAARPYTPYAGVEGGGNWGQAVIPGVVPNAPA